jgi:MFS family permease
MKSSVNQGISRIVPKTLFYGWVIVAACTLIQVMQYGIQYSFGVFFKPLAADFGWSRAATSGAYSVLMVCAGATAIPIGWMADKFGPAKVTATCGLIMGAAIILASQVNQLWQLYITFGVMLGIGIGGTMAITGGVTARWFVKKRGMALGIVSAGIGLGTLIMPPIAERLIAVLSWSQAYIIIGIAACIVTVGAALFLRSRPEDMGLQAYGAEDITRKSNAVPGKNNKPSNPEKSMGLREAIRTRPLWLLCLLFFFVNICVQVVMVHLVNYATDLKIDALAAATLISVIGIGSIIGRLVMGSVSDRIGGHNALIITCVLLVVSSVWLIFSQQMWMLYIFAVFFGFAYGGEVPQMPLLIGQFFGLQAVMALTGATSAATRAGGALGSWFAGELFDVTNSYLIAFTITAVMAVFALVTALMLKRTGNPRR